VSFSHTTSLIARIFKPTVVRHTDKPAAFLRSGDERGKSERAPERKINRELMENCFSRLRLHAFRLRQNQLLALDKENNAIQTTIHTNLLVESFYTTSHGSNNNLLSEMNEFTTNNSQSLTSPARENLLIDGSECTDECNRSTCNCISNDGGNNNDDYGEEEKSIAQLSRF
jgi:hypothetical protein